jgi:hypothetical protein
MVKAIALAFQWRKLQESGTHATVEEIAAAEKINESYVDRILRLTMLAPDIVEAILGGRQPAQMPLAVLMRRFPVLWSAQRSELLHPLNRHDVLGMINLVEKAVEGFVPNGITSET